MDRPACDIGSAWPCADIRTTAFTPIAFPRLRPRPKGTLLCVYDMRRRMGRDLQEDIDIGLSRSTDGGQTWEPVRVIMDMGEYGGLPQEQNGCSDPGIIVDQQTGEIFCFAVWMNGKPGKHQWNDDGSEPGFEIGKSRSVPDGPLAGRRPDLDEAREPDSQAQAGGVVAVRPVAAAGHSTCRRHARHAGARPRRAGASRRSRR